MKKVKTKVKDLALEISVEIKDILSKCKELSIIARSSSSNISDEIGLGISFIAILLSGTSSFVCDIDEKILKQDKKNKNLIIF